MTPGGIGVTGVLEKDVNLSVSLFLKANLEAQGFEVIMTRDADKALYSSESSKSKKKEDLAKRIEIITEAKPGFCFVCTPEYLYGCKIQRRPRYFIIRIRRRGPAWRSVFKIS